MGRSATIVDTVVDHWGDRWDVREERATSEDFPVLLGWPAGQTRGAGGAGGVRIIVTRDLAAHFERHRSSPSGITLPIGMTARKRIRRLLGHHRQIDRAVWWDNRADHLADMTVDAFARLHGVSVGAVVNARHGLFGPKLRPAGWWRHPDVAAQITAERPRAEIADGLGVSVGTIGRLRHVLGSSREPVPSDRPVPHPSACPDGIVDVAAGTAPAPSTRRDRNLEVRTAAIRDVQDGAALGRVAERYGFSRRTLHLWCKAEGLSCKRDYDPRFRADAVKAVQDGEAVYAVAGRIGVMPDSVYRWCRAAGMSFSVPSSRRERDREVRTAAMQNVREGVAISKVAERSGVSTQTVYNWCRAAGMSFNRTERASA